ncbi:MAG: type II toxin-antitoxin system VapC family toxin [Moraxella sp.]|uniref:type II toxin-antitoxin system VapC family toxin n=1 Tax=Moraxella sp. TaxID=479 RepID=UPI0026DD336C|nr:type II toxin-antitoxin system VapC family toxin [Moraxella sp.]MDO4449757.1 type II toxin-antitoxin system VapC family toxin [Moraxella sp.]
MKILLDTHILIWIAGNEMHRFSPKVLEILENRRDNEFFVSLATIWEIAIKSTLKKPNFPYKADLMLKQMRKVGIQLLPITPNNVMGVSELPLMHNDPFDRLLIIQAEQERLYLLTTDNAILKYDKSFILNTKTL